MESPEKKAVYVAENCGHAAEILNKVINFCGRGKYINVVANNLTAADNGPKVLLLCKPCGKIDTNKFSAVIAEYAVAQSAEFSCTKPCKTYSSKTDCADFTARNVRITRDGCVAFEIVGVGIIGRVKLHTGDLNIVNDILAASAAAVAAGISFADVLKALNGI